MKAKKKYPEPFELYGAGIAQIKIDSGVLPEKGTLTISVFCRGTLNEKAKQELKKKGIYDKHKDTEWVIYMINNTEITIFF